MDLAIFAIHIMGASSIMGAINIVVTILNMRATWHDADENAHVLLDLADHCLPAHCCDACFGCCYYHGVDRPSLWHRFFQRRSWW